MPPHAASTIERAVDNESVFRRVNDEIRASASADPPTEEATFVCECSDPNCKATLRLSVEEYGRIRENPTHFVVAAGHDEEAEGFGRVVRYELSHSVVEKLGYAGALAAAAYRGSQDLEPAQGV